MILNNNLEEYRGPLGCVILHLLFASSGRDHQKTLTLCCVNCTDNTLQISLLEVVLLATDASFAQPLGEKFVVYSILIREVCSLQYFDTRFIQPQIIPRNLAKFSKTVKMTMMSTSSVLSQAEEGGRFYLLHR